MGVGKNSEINGGRKLIKALNDYTRTEKTKIGCRKA